VQASKKERKHIIQKKKKKKKKGRNKIKVKRSTQETCQLRNT
jgi:hypothetical protein